MKNEQIIASIVIVLFIAFIGFVYLTSQKKEEQNRKQSNQEASSSSVTAETSSESKLRAELPPMQIDNNKIYTAILRTTEGTIKIELNAKQTPVTVNNFIALAKKNFYNNTIFHRVIKGFMIQGGDPKGDGTGGPGYKFDDEKFEGEYTKGTVAMANSGANTNGSQFFIMHGDTSLKKDYVIFGKVTEGLETVDKIAEAETIEDGVENSKPVKPVKVESVEIIEE